MKEIKVLLISWSLCYFFHWTLQVEHIAIVFDILLNLLSRCWQVKCDPFARSRLTWCKHHRLSPLQSKWYCRSVHYSSMWCIITAATKPCSDKAKLRSDWLTLVPGLSAQVRQRSIQSVNPLHTINLLPSLGKSSETVWCIFYWEPWAAYFKYLVD